MRNPAHALCLSHLLLPFKHPPDSITSDLSLSPPAPVLGITSIMPASAPFLPAAALPSLSRARAHARLHSSAECKSGSSHRLQPVAAALMLMVAVAMSAAFGVARAQGTWSTAQLSVARYYLAAASVGNVALFAGGGYNGA